MRPKKTIQRRNSADQFFKKWLQLTGESDYLIMPFASIFAPEKNCEIMPNIVSIWKNEV